MRKRGEWRVGQRESERKEGGWGIYNLSRVPVKWPVESGLLVLVGWAGWYWRFIDKAQRWVKYVLVETGWYVIREEVMNATWEFTTIHGSTWLKERRVIYKNIRSSSLFYSFFPLFLAVNHQEHFHQEFGRVLGWVSAVELIKVWWWGWLSYRLNKTRIN